MRIDWCPIVRSRSQVDIPEVFVQYDATARDVWIAAQLPFEQSGRTKHSVYGKYAGLA